MLILRPEPAASATAARAERLGLKVRRQPLFTIEPVRWTLPAGHFDGLLLTSANAVRNAGWLPDLPVHTVGEATAKAARAAGAKVVTVGSGGVDALLSALPADQHLLHLAGEERTQPAVEGPTITEVIVYRSISQFLPSANLIEGSVVLIHSPAAGRRLAEVACDRALASVAAISPAAAAACGPGWKACEAADSPDDDSMLFLAARLCKEQR